jgi:hypothetical protein
VSWGQGRDVGLLGSNNSPPLDLVKISNERLFALPWLLRRFGPTQLSLFYADLGKEQNYPGAYFVGYKVSIAPGARLELGATVYSKSGGHGAPRASFSSRVVDIFPFLQAAFYNNVIGTRNKSEFSDRYAGIDGRVRFPSARGLELYAEVLLNDFDVRRLESVLWEDAGHVVGLTMSRLGRADDVAVTVEMHHTGIRYYEHTQFTTGQTLRRTLIGDPLGPNASGSYAFVDWQASGRRSVTLAMAAERYSDDQYLGVALPNGSLRLERVESRPKEMRYRAILTWSASSPTPGLSILSQLGYERTQHFNFNPSLDRNGLLARLGVEYRPR